MWVCAEIFAIAAQAACGSPKAIALSSWPPERTSMVKASFSAWMRSLAASISWRTGVMPRVPMMRLAVISAPTQWEMSMTSWTEQPGKKYLLPPEKPTTSCGKTGPTMRLTSDSTTSLLICTRIGTSVSRPPVSSAICSAEISPRSAIWEGSSQAWLSTVHSG